MRVETKAVVRQKALRSINIDGSVRIDEASGRASVIDTMRLVCPMASCENAAHTFTRVLEKGIADGGNDAIPGEQLRQTVAGRVDKLKINGKGHETPVSDAKTNVEIIWLLPALRSGEFRKQSAETICRVLGGDVSLCDEIEQQCARLQSTGEGRAYQSFVMDRPSAKKHRSKPFWFEHGTDEERKGYVSIEAKKSMVFGEIDIYDTCKQKLESVGRFATRDEIEYADRMKDVQRRASRRSDNLLTPAPVDASAIAVATPVDGTIDPATGLLIATHKCTKDVRRRETSICNEAAKLGIAVGEKAGQVGTVAKRLYIDQTASKLAATSLSARR